jgi:hypothetical protein
MFLYKQNLNQSSRKEKKFYYKGTKLKFQLRLHEHPKLDQFGLKANELVQWEPQKNFGAEHF